MRNPVVFKCEILFLQNGKFEKNWVYITESVLSIYEKIQFAVEGEDFDEPLLQIPVSAIHSVVEYIERTDQIFNL